MCMLQPGRTQIIRKWLFRIFDFEQYGTRSRARLEEILPQTAKGMLEWAKLKNKGIVVVENLYNDPSVKSSYYSVLSGDQSYIDHRDPRKIADIAEALSILEREGLIWTIDSNRAYFKVTAKGERFITGAKFPNRRDLRNLALFAVWIVLLLFVVILFIRV